jgi:hypothetical protein
MMSSFSVDLLELLDDRYDIDIKDYWKLSDEERHNVSIVVIESIFATLKRQPDTIPLYIRLIDDRLKFAEYHDEFEQAEIFNRIKKELLKISPIY